MTSSCRGGVRGKGEKEATVVEMAVMRPTRPVRRICFARQILKHVQVQAFSLSEHLTFLRRKSRSLQLLPAWYRDMGDERVALVLRLVCSSKSHPETSRALPPSSSSSFCTPPFSCLSVHSSTCSLRSTICDAGQETLPLARQLPAQQHPQAGARLCRPHRDSRSRRHLQAS